MYYASTELYELVSLIFYSDTTATVALQVFRFENRGQNNLPPTLERSAFDLQTITHWTISRYFLVTFPQPDFQTDKPKTNDSSNQRCE